MDASLKLKRIEPADRPQGMPAGFKEYKNRCPIQKITAQAVKP
jgi:hypothetical protein